MGGVGAPIIVLCEGQLLSTFHVPTCVLQQCDETGNVITTIFYVGKISNKLNNLSTDSQPVVAELGFL